VRRLAGARLGVWRSIGIVTSATVAGMIGGDVGGMVTHVLVWPVAASAYVGTTASLVRHWAVSVAGLGSQVGAIA
jgi:hypothetical protein